MKPGHKHPKLDSSFQKARAGRPDRQVSRIPGIDLVWLVNGLKSAVCLSAVSIYRWHQQCTMIRKLQALSDHHLRDIGLNRTDIVSYVEKIFVMDRRSKYKLEGYSSNRPLSRTDTLDDREEPISSTEEQSE